MEPSRPGRNLKDISHLFLSSTEKTEEAPLLRRVYSLVRESQCSLVEHVKAAALLGAQGAAPTILDFHAGGSHPEGLSVETVRFASFLERLERASGTVFVEIPWNHPSLLRQAAALIDRVLFLPVSDIRELREQYRKLKYAAQFFSSEKVLFCDSPLFEELKEAREFSAVAPKLNIVPDLDAAFQPAAFEPDFDPAFDSAHLTSGEIESFYLCACRLHSRGALL